MADAASAALARLRDDMIESANGFVPALGPEQAYAAGVFQMAALKAMAALDKVLELHAPTATTRYTEACARHYASMFGRLECPDCRKVERTGCQTCRDENGNPARPEDCKERTAILAALTGKENDGG